LAVAEPEPKAQAFRSILSVMSI